VDKVQGMYRKMIQSESGARQSVQQNGQAHGS